MDKYQKNLKRFKNADKEATIKNVLDLRNSVSKKVFGKDKELGGEIKPLLSELYNFVMQGKNYANLSNKELAIVEKTLGSAREFWGRARKTIDLESAIARGSSGLESTAAAIPPRIKRLVDYDADKRLDGFFTKYNDMEFSLLSDIASGGDWVQRLLGTLSSVGKLALSAGDFINKKAFVGVVARRLGGGTVGEQAKRVRDVVASGIGKYPDRLVPSPRGPQNVLTANQGLVNMGENQEDQMIMSQNKVDPGDLLKEELAAIASLTTAVREALEESNFPELDPEKYFIWMYSVEPFAEA